MDIINKSDSEESLFGEDLDETQTKECPPIFTELLELFNYDDGYQEWKEVARWMKYEEDVEEAYNRWNKPHISTPTLKGWVQLRQNIKNGIVLIDLEANSMSKICEAIAQALLGESLIDGEQAKQLKDLYQLKHRHHFEGPRKIEGTFTKAIKDLLVQRIESKVSSQKVQKRSSESDTLPLNRKGSITIVKRGELGNGTTSLNDGKVNTALQKKISDETEAAVLLVGEVSFIAKPICILVKLANAVTLKDLPEVDIPTRFLFLHTGPPVATADKNDPAGAVTRLNSGIALATAITDKTFARAIFNAKNKDDVLTALDVYTNGLKLLPNEFDTDTHKIEPPSKVNKARLENEVEEIDEDRRMRAKSGLVRSGRLFGGLIQDIKRKKPHYLSDFTDGLSMQCLSSFLFLYFACLAPIIAFGGLLGRATENRIATIESLISGLISGTLFGLFSGQPLIVLGSTGPVYVFEKILYQICSDQNWDYLSLRLWIGIWVALILILLVALDASAYVCYITRFTEELFATLIAFIFIFNALKNLFEIGVQNKFVPETENLTCKCIGNTTEDFFIIDENVYSWDNLTTTECTEYGGTLSGEDCDYFPNIFLMSVVLFVGAFTISFSLKSFRNTGFLPSSIRYLLSDFAVIIAIVSMTGLGIYSGVQTPTLQVPSTFKPTWEGRNWLVAHALIFPDHLLTNPWWVDVFLAPLFAILATILIFMDQQITAVIVNRKEHKLVKGCGYHLDLLVLALIIIICSVFGLPWFVAATVLSINHIQSLTKESECSAPGEKPQFLGIREQRVTNIMIAICIGLSTLITPVLGWIPMPVLFGVFLFMGVSSLKGLQFFDRILLFFIPGKYQPETVYLKYVPIHRVHLFTAIQLMSLIGLWLIKNNSTTSIAFPVMLVVICGIRKTLECIFTRRELRALDDLLPESESKTKRRHPSIFRRINSRNWMEDEDDDTEMNRAKTKKRREAEEEAELERSLIVQARGIATELEDFSKVDIKAKAKQYKALTKAPKGAMVTAARETGPKLIIFVRLENDEVFSPIRINTKTVAGLLRRIEAKFPNAIRAQLVGKVYQRNRKNMVFRLDDDMIELFTDRQVFEIEVRRDNEIAGRIDIYLNEMDDAM